MNNDIHIIPELGKPPKTLSKNDIERGICRGEIEIVYETEWAKDEEGIARPVGTYELYKDKKTGLIII